MNDGKLKNTFLVLRIMVFKKKNIFPHIEKMKMKLYIIL